MSIRPLSPELAEKAKKELNEDPARIASDLQHIKDWIAKQPHLRARTDDQWLIAFLRGCKYSLERTKEKIDLYYTMRSVAPDLTKAVKFGDKKFYEILDLGCNLLLPSTNPTEPSISIIRSGIFDPSKHSMYEIMCVSLILQQITMMDDDATIISGVRTILDLDNVTAGLFAQMTPSLMKKMVKIGQDASPFRIKGAHYLNTPAGFETIYNFIKNMLNDKVKSRLNVHNKNYEEMYKFIPKERLPVEYGGSNGTIQDSIDYWKKKVAEYEQFLKEDEQYGTDEKKRVGRPKTSEDMFGVEGSFRQLQLD